VPSRRDDLTQALALENEAERGRPSYNLSMIGFAYTIFIGIPVSIGLMTLGIFFCVTLVLAPVGFTCFALGSKVLTL
jgi:hypothetical protein